MWKTTDNRYIGLKDPAEFTNDGGNKGPFLVCPHLIMWILIISPSYPTKLSVRLNMSY